MPTATVEEDTKVEATETPTEEKPAKKAKRPYVLTPFQAHKLMNKALEDAGLEGNIQGPMAYSYANQNRYDTRPAEVDVAAGADKPRVEVVREGDHGFDVFLTKFVADRLAKANKATKAEGDEEGDATETAAILSDPETMEAIAEGEAELEEDDNEVEAE
jgi:hypothetical protein